MFIFIVQVLILPNNAHWMWKKIILPLFTLITPVLLAIFVKDLDDLVRKLLLFL